jgi:hypothetical protein
MTKISCYSPCELEFYLVNKNIYASDLYFNIHGVDTFIHRTYKNINQQLINGQNIFFPKQIGHAPDYNLVANKKLLEALHARVINI